MVCYEPSKTSPHVTVMMIGARTGWRESALLRNLTHHLARATVPECFQGIGVAGGEGVPRSTGLGKGGSAGQLDGHEEDGDLGAGSRGANGYRHSGGYNGNGEVLSEEDEADL